MLRYFCKDNVAEVSAAFRSTLSRRSAGTFVFNVCLRRTPPTTEISGDIGVGAAGLGGAR